MNIDSSDFAKGYRAGVEDTWKFLCQRCSFTSADLAALTTCLGANEIGRVALVKIYREEQSITSGEDL